MKAFFLNTILPVLAISFGLGTTAQAQRYAGGTPVDGIIVKIDNQIILRSELEFAHAQVVASGQPATPGLKCEILRSLAMNKLILARADADSVVASEDQVKMELDRRMAYFIAQVGGEQRLEEYYNKSINQLKDELRKQVKDQLVLQKMQGEIAGKVNVTPAEIRKYFNQIPADSLPYFSTEVEVGQIIKIASVGKTQKAEARAKLDGIRKRILAGEDFATLAKEFSQDPVSARDGGNLGFFKKRELVPEYEAAALKLEPGGISPVTESQFGFHLIQLIERRGEEFNTRHILIKPSSATTDLNETAETLDSLRTQILNDKISFAKAAKDFSDDEGTKTNGGLMQNIQQGGSFIPLDKLDPAIFFIIDTMKVGSITPPMPYRTEDGKDAMRIIYLKANKPPHQANLKDDYQKIATAALTEKKAKAMDEWFEKNKTNAYIDVDAEYIRCDIFQLPN